MREGRGGGEREACVTSGCETWEFCVSRRGRGGGAWDLVGLGGTLGLDCCERSRAGMRGAVLLRTSEAGRTGGGGGGARFRGCSSGLKFFCLFKAAMRSARVVY